MLAELKKENIFIELDVLLDTRIGTLAELSQDLAADVLINHGYTTRESDSFPGYGIDEFRKLYDARTTNVLAHSRPTLLLTTLASLSDTLMGQAISTPYHSGAVFEISIGRYDVSDEEAEYIKRAIVRWAGNDCEVKIVRHTLMDITPQQCRDGYSMLIVYEYGPWFEKNLEAFKKVRMPTVLMLAPALYFVKVPTEEELKDNIESCMHPFQAVQISAAPMIELRLIDPAFFSIALDVFVDAAKKEIKTPDESSPVPTEETPGSV